MTYCRRLHWGVILQVRGTLCNFTVGLKMDRFKPSRIVGLMSAGCVVLTLLVALFSDSFARAATLVLLLGHVLMPANGALLCPGERLITPHRSGLPGSTG